MIGVFWRSQWRMVLWAVAMLLLACMGLHQAPLFDVDEGAFSEATREMLSSHDWGHTTLNGADRFDKPIFIYWLQAASVATFGLYEWALRLPSALAAWAWALALALFARRYWGQAVGMLAGTMLLTCVGVMAIGRSATADALLNLWLVLAALDLWRVVECLQSPSRSGASDAWRMPLRRAALWLGLGMLTKGPVAWLVPGAAVAVWWLTTALMQVCWAKPVANMGFALWASLTSVLRQCRLCLSDAWAWLILLGVSVPWYVYAWDRHGWAFINGFFVQHNLQRYGSTFEGHSGSLFYYVLMVPVLLLPWSFFLAPVLRHARMLWQEGLSRYLLGWAAFVVVFFSLSGTKLPHYLLYGISPLVLLMARVVHQQLGPDIWVHRLTALVLFALPLLCAALSAWVVKHGANLAAPHLRSLYAALLAGLPVVALQVSAVVISVGVLGIFALARWRKREHDNAGAAYVYLPLAAVCVCLFVVLRLIPTWGEALQGPVRNAAQAGLAFWNKQPQGTMRGCVQWGLHQPSIGLYLQQPCPVRAPKVGELALVRRYQLPSLAEQSWQPRPLPMPEGLWDVVYDGPAFMLVHWRGVQP